MASRESAPSITAESGGDGLFLLKIAAVSFELNIWLTAHDVTAFSDVSENRWVNGAVVLGTCAGTACHWSMDAEELSILVGKDDQTWDIAFTIPAATLTSIRAELAQALSALNRP